jgi:hypothetical protein
VTAQELIEILERYPGTTPVLLDDERNGALVAPTVRVVRADNEGGSIVLCSPSQLGGVTSDDRLTTSLMELEMLHGDGPEGDDGDRPR